MKIYGFPTFNISKVLLAAEFIGIDYQYVALDPVQGEHKAPDHIAQHPLGKVPALEHDGQFFFESAAICRYLARVAQSPLYAGDAAQLAVVDQWIDMLVQHIGRWMGVIFWQEVIRRSMMGLDPEADALVEARQFLDQQLPILEQQLSRHAFICGDNMSLADIIGAAYMQISEVTSLELGAYPVIGAWYARLREDVAYQRAMEHFPGRQLYSAANGAANA